jgi:ABC-type multidrug transport system, ATPase component
MERLNAIDADGDASAQRTLALRLDSVRKTYGDTIALDAVSLQAHRGQIVGLLGPNGAGKTTAISCIAGLFEPDAGSIEIFGADPHTAVSRGHVALASQEIALYPGLTVRQNLSLFAGMAGLRGASLEANLEAVVTALALGHIEEKQVARLSVGQQRIAHVACALAMVPTLVILDEPTNGLDVAARRALLAYLRVFAQRGGSVLLSSHYLREVEEVCDVVFVLDHGSCIAQGTVSDLVAEFGGGHVEIELGEGGRVVEPGNDVVAILNRYSSSDVLSVTVVPPSLETVFMSLTGRTVSEAEEGND